MTQLKNFIKKNFTSFTFFYSIIGYRIFIMLSLSFSVSVLDGFGLTMFLPLLQMVSGDGVIDAEKLGSLSFLLHGAEASGISMTIVTVLIFMVIFFIFKGIAFYLSQVFTVLVGQYFIRTIRLRLLKALNVLNFKKFITSDAGQIQNTMSGEVDKVSIGYQTYLATFQQALMVFVYLGFAFFVDWQFAILVAVGGALTNFVYKTIYTRTKDASRKLTGASNLYQGLIIQHVANFKYLRATNMVKSHSKKLEENIYEIEESRKKMGILSAIGAASREPLLVIVVASVIFIQVKFLDGTMGAILISLLFFYRALSSLVGMQQSWNSFLGVSGSLENMQTFQRDLDVSKEKNGIVVFDRFEKGIDGRHLSFSFAETPILTDINLHIPKNQSVAFVGESGSGKTTLVNVLAGLLRVDQGELLVDGKPMQILNKNTFQNRIGYITQEAVIFNDTIYNNISFWAEKTPENLKRFEKAVSQASLNRFLQELPNGKETELENNGINLSGGQKQRISIARELFKDIDILIMDEATSALDSETEKAIQDSIDELHGKYTLLIVAHRLSTIRNVDKVVYMNKGMIEKEGSFVELMDIFPKFKKMVELQEL